MVSFKDECENDSLNQIHLHVWAITMIYTVHAIKCRNGQYFVGELLNLRNPGT